MESITENARVHHGHNVKLGRCIKGVKQDNLAFTLNMSQSEISRLETLPYIETEILDKIALALDVPLDFLKNFETDQILKSYTFTNQDKVNEAIANEHSKSTIVQAQGEQENIINNYPIDDIKDLYDKLLAEKDKQIERFEKHVSSLEIQIEELRKRLDSK